LYCKADRSLITKSGHLDKLPTPLPDRCLTVELIALELFREEKISLGLAAELCRTPLAAFMDSTAAYGISPIRYSVNELEEDRWTLAELGRR
jgi:hypothetical protein